MNEAQRSEDPLDRFVSADFTHYLKCRHCNGTNSCSDYYMKCLIIKDMPNGRKKIIVFGNMMWGGEDKKIRYVPASKLHLPKH